MQTRRGQQTPEGKNTHPAASPLLLASTKPTSRQRLRRRPVSERARESDADQKTTARSEACGRGSTSARSRFSANASRGGLWRSLWSKQSSSLGGLWSRQHVSPKPLFRQRLTRKPLVEPVVEATRQLVADLEPTRCCDSCFYERSHLVTTHRGRMLARGATHWKFQTAREATG